jgi:PDZ domain
MKKQINHLFLMILSTGVILISSFAGELCAKENAEVKVSGSEKTVSSEYSAYIKQLLSDLDHDDYQKRRSAHEKLLKANSRSIPLLEKAAHEASLELSSRILLIMEHHLRNSKVNYSEPAIVAMENFLESKNRSLIYPSVQIWNRNINAIEIRAISKIISLGGKITKRGRASRFNQNSTGVPSSKIERLDLTEKWKGGEEGLRYISRLRNLVSIYSVDGNGLDEKDFQELEAKLPNLRVIYRGRCKLGISCPEVGECRVMHVEPGSSAFNAGIQKEDVILEYNGKGTPSFTALTDLIAKSKPGEKVKVTINRYGMGLELNVVMKAWSAKNKKVNPKNPRLNPGIPAKIKKKVPSKLKNLNEKSSPFNLENSNRKKSIEGKPDVRIRRKRIKPPKKKVKE